jgi:ribosomal protein L37AE/L43A
MTDQTAIQVSSGNFLAPAASLTEAKERYSLFKQFVSSVLEKGRDYGIVPGVSKPTLLKPGAEKLGAFFGLRPTFLIQESVNDWTGKDHGEPFFFREYKCQLLKNGELVGEGIGSCNSWEKKYRYRQSERVCPECGKPTIIKGKEEYGGGWLCYGKKGGCSAKFADNAPEIINQEVGQVANKDVADQVNTIDKMAQKRALVAAILIATNASDYFTQDMEDFADHTDIIDGSFKEVSQPVTSDQKVTDDQLYDCMNGKVIELFATSWNISKSDAAKEVSKLKEVGKITGKMSLSDYQKLAYGGE